MRTIKFVKMVASGNDFVVIENKHPLSAIRYPLLAKAICDRKYGVGADGLLVLEKSRITGVKMRIFNADGSEAEMCGNGARCVALYAKRYALNAKNGIKIGTRAGIIEAQVKGDNVKIKLTDPTDIKLDIPVRINNRIIKVNFIDTGVPHAVIFVEGMEKIDIVNLGRQIRFHKDFAPKGANVDFVEVLSGNSIKARTYERGVEDETLACGTGSVASAVLSAIRYPLSVKINVQTKGGEILKVYFERIDGTFKNIWLEGKAGIVFKGVICR